MNQHLVPGQGDSPLIKGIACLLSAERVTELNSLLGNGMSHQVRGVSPLAVVTALAIRIEQHRLDRTLLPIYHGREQLMAGAADLLGREASFEDQDAFRLLALLLDKLLRGGGDSRQAKLDGLTPSVMEQRALAAISPNTGSVVRGSWRRKSRNQLGHASWLDVVEAALWCFWHGDALESGEVLLGVLLGRDERVRGVYGLLAGAFYMNKSAGC